jgi:hypothetical protein
MASQVISATGNVTYTNSTGQNVRLVINYMTGTNISLSWGTGASASTTGTIVFGKSVPSNVSTLPTELMLSAGQTFSSSGSTSHNIVIIKEDGT